MGKRQRRRERERIDAIINTPFPTKAELEEILGAEMPEWQYEWAKPALRGEPFPKMFVVSTTRRR